jgi:hypothetical protein
MLEFTWPQQNIAIDYHKFFNWAVAPREVAREIFFEEPEFLPAMTNIIQEVEQNPDYATYQGVL